MLRLKDLRVPLYGLYPKTDAYRSIASIQCPCRKCYVVHTCINVSRSNTPSESRFEVHLNTWHMYRSTGLYRGPM